MGNGKSGVAKKKRPSNTPTTLNTTTSSDADIQSGFSQMGDNAAYDLYFKATNNREDANGNKLDLTGLNRFNDFQNVVASLNMHEKPVVLSNDAWDNAFKNEALDGVYLWRGVTGGNGLTQAEVVDNLKFGDKTFIGEGVHGDGLYFTTRRGYADMYSGNNDSGLVQAYIDKSKANVITEKNILEMRKNDPTSMAALDISSYALYKGYNVIHVPGGNSDRHSGVVGQGNSYRDANGKKRVGGEDFYVPLTRSVLVIRDKAK